ncbi:hypothetical protein GW17_00040050 [Ensete ventricosum]|nr:hypothetical protein GW17_00040050 [Ensete ventricosum]
MASSSALSWIVFFLLLGLGRCKTVKRDVDRAHPSSNWTVEAPQDTVCSSDLFRLSLYLSFNHFKGEIPVELANLPELRYLYLHENRLTGKIPPELGTLKNLRHLYQFSLFLPLPLSLSLLCMFLLSVSGYAAKFPNNVAISSDVSSNHLTGTLADFIRNGDGFPSLRNL